ncbi:sulfatase [Flagellimonas marina]|uniref:Sulfatase n=1 Tax=Flagellimonas marina TaxID=1775168 RepID=A0ABV8PTN4_9FLAO
MIKIYKIKKRRSIAGIFALLLSFQSCQSSRFDQKPNIIIINIDDMGWRDVGFMGSEFYETPNLDRLASEGAIFTNAYAAASNCAPSRACLMSGQWSPRHGIYTVRSSFRGRSKDRKLIPTETNITLAKEQYTLAEVLRDGGYATCHAGKWHLGNDPTTQGFDLNIGGSHAGKPGNYFPPYKNVELNPPSEDYNLTRLVMDKALEFVETTDQSFFLYYSPYAVHGPIQPVKELLPKYERKASWNGQDNIKYATMIENLDKQVGRLVDLLEATGKLENTFIVFTSDNGGVYSITKQWPLRAGKGSYYEGGIREPMFAYWKGKIDDGIKIDVPVTNLDFYPTILEVTGIKKPANKILDGNSFASILSAGNDMPERPLFWHFPIYLQDGNKETQDSIFRTRPGSAIRLGDWKLIQYFENNDIELYNLKNDIGEKTNLADVEPSKVDELLKILENWRSETNAPVPVKLNPDYSNSK